MLKLRRKINKIRFHRELAKFKKSEQAGKIVHIQIEPTARCNLHCITCSRDAVLGEYKKMDMSLGELDKILSMLPDLKTVKLGGLGEPLLHPQLEEFLKKLKEKNIRTWLNTNGTAFLNGRLRKIVLKYVDDVAVSFDSTDKSRFEKIRVGANMDKIKEGTKLFVQERNNSKSETIIGINFVVSHLNYEEVGDDLYNLVTELKVDYLTITEVENWMVEGETAYEESRKFVAMARNKTEEIVERIKKLRMRLLWKGIIVGHKTSAKRLGKCYWAFNGFFVNNEGFVTPCNIRMHKKYAFGNLFEMQNIAEILDGKNYTDFRKCHIGDKMNPICKNCPD